MVGGIPSALFAYVRVLVLLPNSITICQNVQKVFVSLFVFLLPPPTPTPPPSCCDLQNKVCNVHKVDPPHLQYKTLTDCVVFVLYFFLVPPSVVFKLNLVVCFFRRRTVVRTRISFHCFIQGGGGGGGGGREREIVVG